MFEVVLGILPPITTNYLFIFDKGATGPVRAFLGGGGGKRRREGEATANATTAQDSAAAAARPFSHHKENKEGFSGRTQCSLLTGFGES